MYQRVLSVSNDAEAASIKGILEMNSIPYAEKHLHEGAMPMIEGHHYAIEIIFPEEASFLVFSEISTEYPSRITEIESKTKNSKIWQIVTFFYAIVVTIGCLKYYDMAQRSENKNFSVQWSLDNTHVTEIHKSNNGMQNRYYDQNYDNNYEKTESYTKNKKIAVSIDKNEDGIAESSHYYSIQGTPSGSSIDKNQDGIQEKSIVILASKDSLILHDTNQDGMYDILKFNNKVLVK